VRVMAKTGLKTDAATSQLHRRADKSLLWIEGGSSNHIAELAISPAMLQGLLLQAPAGRLVPTT
jgi:hypothetical protein